MPSASQPASRLRIARWLIAVGVGLTVLGWAAAFSVFGLVALVVGSAALLAGVGLAPSVSSLGWLATVLLVGWLAPIAYATAGPPVGIGAAVAGLLVPVLMWRTRHIDLS